MRRPLRPWVRRVLPPPARQAVRRGLMRANALAGLEAHPIVPAAAPGPDTSQAGEVAELRDLLQPDFPKTLVDVGAFDGVTISNSRPFTLQGWRAILVEPHPAIFAKLSAASEGMNNVVCENLACSDTAGTFPLYLGADGPDSAMSTICTDDTPWMDVSRSKDSVDVTVVTLTELLARHDWPADFSMLFVDAEGMDYEVLKGLDFKRYRPRIVVTEEYISNPDKHRRKYRLLMDEDYTFFKMVGANTIWLANEWLGAMLGLADSVPGVAVTSTGN
jgi:FkbM family methyltransferase